MESYSQYDKLIKMMNNLDLQDDGILQNQKIKDICIDFCNIVKNEDMLNESMEYINEKALEENDTSLKFALLFSSRFFDSLAMNALKVRSKMMSLLEMNYQNAKQYLKEDKKRLYNSITLLGECFHRIRTSQNDPIHILGKSLLNLLIQTIKEDDYIDQTLARVILSQITLNGSNMKYHHKEEIDELLFHVRRNLIEQNNLTDTVKALLLMTLDLHNNNISNLSKNLVEMYTDYLKRADDSTENIITIATNSSPSQVQKKWSEQVGEELYNDTNEGDNSIYSTNVNNLCQREQYWRQPRYNSKKQNMNNDDDKNSVRSDGGSSRIYNRKDTFRGSPRFDNLYKEKRFNQNKGKLIEPYTESGNNHSMENTQSNKKRNEYINKQKFNSSYERPPRFRQKDFENTWRNKNSRAISQAREYNRDFSETREGFNNSRSSSRSKHLTHSQINENNGRRSVSPSSVSERHFRPQQSRNFSSNRNSQCYDKQYSSQCSLTSDYSTCDRRTFNNYKRSNYRENGSCNGKSNNPRTSNTNNEIVRRETTKYLETLSQR
ncbi:hypothetical protein ACFFRR_009629 [Megaselia abdita]